MRHLGAPRVAVKTFLQSLIVVAALTGLAACGDETGPQQAAEPKRVGVLLGVDALTPASEGFRDGMVELGHVLGEDLIIDVRSAGGDKGRMKEIAEALVAEKVDVLFAISNGAAVIAKKAAAGSSVPVFFAVVMAPLKSGLVDSMSRPSGNVTGIRNPADEYIGKRLEMLRRMVPDAKRVWVPFEPNYPTSDLVMPSIRATATEQGLDLMETAVERPADIVAHLEKLDKPNFDVIFIMPNPATQHEAAVAAMLAYGEKHGIPVIGNTPSHVQQGALFSYLVDLYQTGRMAADYIDPILDMENFVPNPVVNSEPKLVINTKAADRLGVTIDGETKAFATDIY